MLLVEPVVGLAPSPIVRNLSPTVSQKISSSSAADVTNDRTTLSALGNDDKGEKNLVYRWRTVSAPRDGSISFSDNNRNSAKRTNLIFNRAGQYVVGLTIADAGGLTTTLSYKINVVPTLTQLYLRTPSNQALNSTSKLSVEGTGTSLVLEGKDQFGQKLAITQTVVWTTKSSDSGQPASIKAAGNAASVTFKKIGNYNLMATVGRLSTTVAVSVVPKFASIAVDSAPATVASGTSQKFTARGLDQFNNPLTQSPALTWSSTAGSIDANGLWKAPTHAGAVEIKASSGSFTSRANIRVAAANNPGGFQNAALAQLVTTHFADGSITRPDMIKILRSAGIDGRVDTTELADLRTLVRNSVQYNIPDHVRDLASDVVNSNPANAKYGGAALGNLAEGSSATQLNLLIDKWFYGTDRPATTSSSYAYQAASGNLFYVAPSHLNQPQGAVGDCYFISSLGIIASKNPAAIRDMFIDNQDGTFTVRFFTGLYNWLNNPDGSASGGFSAGTARADYVTVDRYLPSSGGRLVYANQGSQLNQASNSLWMALAEKAYAQWNETGNSGRQQVANSYTSIAGGWMSSVNAQVLGQSSRNYALASADKQQLIGALKANEAVTIGTKSQASDSLAASHAYSIVSYDAQTDRFQLYNPWGFQHPPSLSYSQLQANCTHFVVAGASRLVSTPGGMSTPTVRGDHWMFETTHSYAHHNEIDEPDLAQVAEFINEIELDAPSTDWQIAPNEMTDASLAIERMANDADAVPVLRSLETIDAIFGSLADDSFYFAS